MPLVLNEDQLMLKEAAKSFCQESAPISLLRKLRDSNDSNGYDTDVWKQIVELGWTGMTISESYGGFEFGYTGLGVVLEETGRTLLNSPLISTVLLGATAVSLGDNDTWKEKLLPGVVSGDTILALAIDETPHHNPAVVRATAAATDHGFVLNGQKLMVLDGHLASHFIVSARTSGNEDSTNGISLFVVDANNPGVAVQSIKMVDNRNAAIVTFEDVSLDNDSLLSELDGGFALLDRVLDIGRIGLAAEMLGSTQEVFERVLEYLTQREQFGVPIGAFQALQHRAAEMYCEIELCRSAVLAALQEIDNNGDRVAELASLAKAKLSEVLENVSNEGVQMHGGIGMTDEFDIGFFMKRARVAQQQLGDALFHRNRYASLCDI